MLKKHEFWRGCSRAALVVCGLVAGSSMALGNVRPGDLVSLRSYDLSVDDSVNQAYAPTGIRVHDFVFSPSINTAFQYSDNVYATEVDRVHDLMYSVRPQLNVKSDFIRHEISAGFSAERGLYHDISSENYTDYSARFDARFDISGQTSLPIGISYDRDHYRRGSFDDSAGDEPTKFDLYRATAGLVHRGQRIAVRVMSEFKRYVFEDGLGVSGLVRNSDRDRDEMSLYTSVGLAEEGFFAPFVYSELSKQDYDNRDSIGRDRSSFDYEAGAGTILNISDVTKAAFRMGYTQRNPEDGSFSDFGALTFGGNILWSPSTLASFQLEGERSIQETYDVGASGRVDSTLRFSMNYEMFSNLFLKPYIGVAHTELEGIDKEIKNFNTGMDMTYKMNRNVWLSANYRYTNQDEQGVDSDNEQYDVNTYGLSLKLQF